MVLIDTSFNLGDSIDEIESKLEREFYLVVNLFGCFDGMFLEVRARYSFNPNFLQIPPLQS